MAAYSRTRAEQETIIRFDAEQRQATIYTADPVYVRKLDKLTVSNPESYRLVWTEQGGNAKKYTAPSRLIRFGKPASEARKAAGKRLASFSSKTPSK